MSIGTLIAFVVLLVALSVSYLCYEEGKKDGVCK